MGPNDQRPPEVLGAELEARLLRRFALEWRAMNYRHFRGALRSPVIALGDEPGPLARWRAPLRTLELWREGVLTSPWAEVLEAIKRAAAWQYVDERLTVDPRNRHPSYRRICRHLGIVSVEGHGPRSGSGPAREASGPSTRMTRRIHKLLALARSPNQHEAENAATAARRLMFKFNIEHDEAARLGAPPEAQTRASSSCDERGYSHRHLGRPRGPLLEHDRRLAKLLTDYFFVHSAWLPVYLPRTGARAVVLEICGLEANLSMAAHVHDFLRQTSARLWVEYRDASARVGPNDRAAFLAGVMSGFEAKLADQDQQLRAQGLVWVPAPGLGQYFRRRHPGLAYTHVGGGVRSVAYERGTLAGRRIVLSPPLASPTRSASGVPLALGRGAS